MSTTDTAFYMTLTTKEHALSSKNNNINNKIIVRVSSEVNTRIMWKLKNALKQKHFVFFVS